MAHADTILRRMINERKVLDLVPVSRSTLQDWVRTGNFPKPVSIGPRRKAWYEDEVMVWQAAKSKQRGK